MSSPLGAVAKCASTLESTGFPRSPAQEKAQRAGESAEERFWFTPNYEHNFQFYKRAHRTGAFNSHNSTLVSALVHRAVAITRAVVPLPVPMALSPRPLMQPLSITTDLRRQILELGARWYVFIFLNVYGFAKLLNLQFYRRGHLPPEVAQMTLSNAGAFELALTFMGYS